MAGLIGRMLPVIGDLRRLPAALDLAYLAAGRLDAAVLVDTKPWDVAAGLLIAAEAGAHYGSAPRAAGARRHAGRSRRARHDPVSSGTRTADQNALILSWSMSMVRSDAHFPSTIPTR